jgi:hypothetical protein
MELATQKTFDLSPQTFEQALTFSKYLANSDMVPKDFKGKPENCLVAMQWGMEIGMKPLQALQNIAVINGRPSLWGDALIALARQSGLCEYILEDDDGTTAFCRIKRKGEPEQVRTFGDDDAKRAGLFGKSGPWQQYPARMRQLRARAFAIRDVFPDVLKGLHSAEESQDLPKDMGMADVVQRPAIKSAIAPAASLPECSDEKFEQNLPIWRDLIESGKAPLEQVLATLRRKCTLTTEQLATLEAIAPQDQGDTE